MPTATLHLSLNAKGPEVKKLHDTLIKAGFKIPKNETNTKLFGVGTKNALLKLQKKYNLSLYGFFDKKTKTTMVKTSAVTESANQRNERCVFPDNGLPAAGMRLQLFNTRYDRRKRRLARTKTDDEGFYSLPLDGVLQSTNRMAEYQIPNGGSHETPRTQFIR